MLRYENIANMTLLVNLHNNYSIVAMVKSNHKEEVDNYNMTLYIKRNDIDILDLIESQENINFDSNSKTIRVDVTKHITTLLSNGFFDYYIERYQNLFEK